MARHRIYQRAFFDRLIFARHPRQYFRGGKVMQLVAAPSEYICFWRFWGGSCQVASLRLGL